MFYETDEMEHSTAIGFAALFDEAIGTKREINRAENGLYYVVCTELEGNDPFICRCLERRAKAWPRE